MIWIFSDLLGIKPGRLGLVDCVKLCVICMPWPTATVLVAVAVPVPVAMNIVLVVAVFANEGTAEWRVERLF